MFMIGEALRGGLDDRRVQIKSRRGNEEQGGVGGIAQQRCALGAPVAHRRTVMQRPAIALVAIGSIDDGLDRRMPALVVLLQKLPREFLGPGFFRGEFGLDDADEIQQRAAAQVIADGMAAGAHEHRHAPYSSRRLT